MLTANAALAKLANYKKKMEKQAKHVKGRVAALRHTVYDAAVVVNDQIHNNTKNFIEGIRAAFPGKNPADAYLEDTFHAYIEFDGDYRYALRAVEMGATKKAFVASPFTAAFKNPLPKHKPDGRTARARLDILDTEDTGAPRMRHVEFDAADDEPRVTPTPDRATSTYETIKQLEQENATLRKLNAALLEENAQLKAKLSKARAA